MVARDVAQFTARALACRPPQRGEDADQENPLRQGRVLQQRPDSRANATAPEGASQLHAYPTVGVPVCTDSVVSKILVANCLRLLAEQKRILIPEQAGRRHPSRPAAGTTRQMALARVSWCLLLAVPAAGGARRLRARQRVNLPYHVRKPRENAW
jgi:hypothetical protein